jgi:hypothetical protein
LGDSLMKHVVYTAQEVFSKRNAFATSQLGSHYNVIQSGLIGFTTENESTQPHVQERSVLNVTQGTILHVFLDIIYIHFLVSLLFVLWSLYSPRGTQILKHQGR